MKTKKRNKFAEKIKTAAIKKKTVVQYCEHLKRGYSKHSFPELDFRTVEKYARELKLTDSIKKAERESLLFWERQGIENLTKKLNEKVLFWGIQNKTPGEKINLDEITVTFNKKTESQE